MLAKFQDDQRSIVMLPGVTLNSVTPPSNLLLNSYFEGPIVGLHVLYVLNMHANFYTNRM